MSAAVVKLEGLDELRAALRALPAALRAEGMTIVHEETIGAATEIEQAYAAHRVTGHLAGHVTTDFPSSTILAGVVKATSPHAHLFEFGTQVRTTASGASRGAAPPHPTTVPIARKHRQRMNRRLIEMVQAHGFEASGDAGG